jgi:hypothetical protein
MSYAHFIEAEGLLQNSEQPATEPKHKLHKMRPQQGGNSS